MKQQKCRFARCCRRERTGETHHEQSRGSSLNEQECAFADATDNFVSHGRPAHAGSRPRIPTSDVSTQLTDATSSQP